MNPKKLGGLANHKQEPWKMPLPLFIEHLYEKRFGRKRPQDVRPIEVKEAERRQRKQAKKEARAKTVESEADNGVG